MPYAGNQEKAMSSIPLCDAIVMMADLAFHDTDFIGAPKQTRALIVPLLHVAGKHRRYSRLFFYRGHGFTTFGLDESLPHCGVIKINMPQEWKLKAHNVTGWRDAVGQTLTEIENKTSISVPCGPTGISETFRVVGGIYRTPVIIDVLNVTVSDKIRKIHVAYKKVST